jgi:hypothetical protein
VQRFLEVHDLDGRADLSLFFRPWRSVAAERDFVEVVVHRRIVGGFKRDETLPICWIVEVRVP